MDGPFRIGVVLSARPWSTRLHSFIADHVPNVELVMVRDQQAAIETSPDVLLVDESTPWLTASFVSRARSAGVRLVGVYERSGRAGQAHLAEVGISHQFEEAMPPDDVVFLLGRLRPHERPADDKAESLQLDTEASPTRGVVMCVGGPSGSGAREIAVALACASGDRGWRTLLVDANESTPGVAQRLGLGIYPHILTAIDRRREGKLDGTTSALADGAGRGDGDGLAA